jgi:hypothetical protein
MRLLKRCDAMLTDADLRERCARLGKTRVEENYSWDVVARKTFALFNAGVWRQSHADATLQFERANHTSTTR